MSRLFATALAGAALALAVAPAWAHGGQYRGPPGGGPAPGIGGPGTGGPLTGGPAAGGPNTGGTGALPSARWQVWWEFNKDPFLDLKRAIHAATAATGSDEFFMGGSRRPLGLDTLKPRRADVVDRILPALERALDSTDQRDIVSSCLIAMAKAAPDHESSGVLDRMRAHLRSRDQEVRETAALAMGISQMGAAVETLAALAGDTKVGRELCQRSQVDDRTRAFACYGLGLIAHGSEQGYVKRKCFEALRGVLVRATAESADRNVPVAAISGLRLLRPDRESPAGARILADALEVLWGYYRQKVGPGEQQVQAHVPPAIAQLLGRGGDRAGKYKDAFADELDGAGGARSNALQQSAAIALGALCEAPEEHPDDRRHSDTLRAYFARGRDEQTRYFCLMALARIGGEHNRSELLAVHARGSKALVKPWSALALGVLAFRARQAAGDGGRADVTVGRALHADLLDLKNPETQSALAVALGLCGYRDAAADLEELLVRNRHRDELAGYLCIGLALMDSKRSMDVIRGVVEQSVRRPELLRQAAIALGKLGDKSVTGLLQEMLLDPNRNVAKLGAVASALGFIGDRRTIDPLIAMLHDPSITPLSRAFAAVALGGVADKEPLRWNSKIAVDTNYRATVESLTNGTSGILDLL